MNNTPPCTTLWNKNFCLLLFNALCINLCFQIIIPILPQYCLSLDFTLAHAGMLTGLFAFAALILRPFCGAFADHFNMKYLTLMGSLIMASGSLMLVIPTTHLGVLMIPRIIQGFGFALNGTACGALATRYMPSEKLGQGVGYISLASLLAAAFGAPIGLFVCEHVGFQAIFLLSAVLGILSMAAVLPIQYTTEKDIKKKACAFSIHDFFIPSLLPLMYFSGFFSMITALDSSFIPVLASERGITGFSAFFIIQSVMMLITRPFAGKLTDAKGGSFIILPGYLFTAATLLLLSFSVNRYMIFAAALTAAFGMGCGSPACQTECIKKVGPQKRGAAVSTYYMGCDIANTIGPMIGGIVAGQFGCHMMFLGAAALSVITFFLYLGYSKWERAV